MGKLQHWWKTARGVAAVGFWVWVQFVLVPEGRRQDAKDLAAIEKSMKELDALKSEGEALMRETERMDAERVETMRRLCLEGNEHGCSFVRVFGGP